MQQNIRCLGNVIVFTIFINVNLMAQSLYFSSPQESVELTSKLMIEEDWGKLSNYYFLDNSDEEVIESIKNGKFFILR